MEVAEETAIISRLEYSVNRNAVHVSQNEPFNTNNTIQNFNYGLVFTSGFSDRLASDNQKSHENSCFSISLKVKRVGQFQKNCH